MAPRGRPRAFDREKALDAATELFWRQGYSATSMADLCAAMGINAPSLYAAFGSKEELYAAAIAHFSRTASPAIWGGLDAAPTAYAAIEGMLLGSARTLPGIGHPPGCMVTLSAVGQECGGRLGSLVADARQESVHLLSQRLERAIAAGELPASLDVAAIARFYTCVQQGMSIQARDGAGFAELEAVARAALAAWPALTAPAAPPHRQGERESR